MNESVNILLVDDEFPALDNIRIIVTEIWPLANIFTADNYKEALDIALNNVISIALLDVEMPGMTGVELGRRLKAINPRINIIFATAYDRYAFDAIQIFNSGYLLKPIQKAQVIEQFKNLRYPVTTVDRKLKVRCFGNFDVYFRGEPVQFERSKSKEVLAYLIDRQGARVTIGELTSAIYEDFDDEQKNKQKFYSAWFALKKSLKSINYEDVLIHSQNAYAVNTALLDCDYYRYLEGDEDAIRSYRGQYMYQYGWAEFSFGKLF